ncbi:MAG TPA: hypothetical protein VFV75_02345 [Candidatus Polarisedimenticolaceae bacterium]|nr:hypothetical protein [Candidatus Polarisedimenticolaceae bacterium]
MKVRVVCCVATCATAVLGQALEWKPLPGDLTDVGVAVNGALFAIGANVAKGGKSIHRWTGSGWKPVPGGAVRIAVDPDGNPWVVNDAGAVYRRTKSKWEDVPPLPAPGPRATAPALDVGIGADGTVWVLGRGGALYRWSGSAWTTFEGRGDGVALAVGPKGEPWIVSATGDVQRFQPDTSSWTRFPGQAQDVAVAADGTVFIVGAGPGTVHRLEAGTWVADPAASGSRISAGPAGTVVVLKAGAPFLTGTLRPPA